MKLPRPSFRTAAGWSLVRVPGAAQHEVVRCRHRSRVYPRSAPICAQVGQVRLAWTVPVRGGPGSATHRFAPLALHRIRDTRYRPLHSSFHSHDSNSPSRSRGAFLRERAFAAARAGWSDPCIFLFFCRFGSSIPGLTISNNTHFPLPTRTPSFPRRILRPGFASLLHSPRIEGWAERRETFGCSGTRAARHNAACQAPSEAPCVP